MFPNTFIRAGAVALSANSVLDGVGDVWLTNVMCLGTESTLLSCPGATLGSVSTCVHPEDIGVRCVAANGRGTFQCSISHMHICRHDICMYVCMYVCMYIMRKTIHYSLINNSK